MALARATFELASRRNLFRAIQCVEGHLKSPRLPTPCKELEVGFDELVLFAASPF